MRYFILALFLASCAENETVAPVSKPEVFLTVELDETTAILTASSPNTFNRAFIVNGERFDVNDFSLTLTRLDPRKEYKAYAVASNQSGQGVSKVVTFYPICSSTLECTYTYSTVTPFCSGTLTGAGSLTLKNNAIFAISDASFGMYACFYGEPVSYGIEIWDTCGLVELKGKDQFDVTYNWQVVSNSGDDLVIDWSNSYGDFGLTTLTRDGGWPEF